MAIDGMVKFRLLYVLCDLANLWFDASRDDFFKNNVSVGYDTNGWVSSKQWQGNVSFPAINANVITDRHSIRITSIDGIPAEAVARQKRINIMSAGEFVRSYGEANNITRINADGFVHIFSVNENEINRYNGNKTNVIIPSVINGIIIRGIGNGAFREKGLTSVTIPNSVTSIGNEAFAKNQLTSVIIPNSVTEIGWFAFRENQLTSITIGANVRFVGGNMSRPFSNGFEYTYDRLAGTFTRPNSWSETSWIRQ